MCFLYHMKKAMFKVVFCPKTRRKIFDVSFCLPCKTHDSSENYKKQKGSKSIENFVQKLYRIKRLNSKKEKNFMPQLQMLLLKSMKDR